MEFKRVKYFIVKIFEESERLQKTSIKGTAITKRKYTQSQKFSFIIALTTIYFLPKGFNDNFAGFIISFLGIFIGLFTSIVVSMHDKSSRLIENLDTMPDIERARNIKIKNYLIHFTAFTGASIIIGLFVTILLSIVLLTDSSKENIFNYNVINELEEISILTITNFVKLSLLLLHRLMTVYLLLRFFIITTYSISSYFSFLISDYNRLKIKNP